MRRTIHFIVLILIVSACSKKDSGDFIFEKTLAAGLAHDIIITDSLYVVAGASAGSPYLIRINKSGSMDMEYKSDISGAYTSVLDDTSGYYVSGYSNGNMLLARIGHDGEEDWSAEFTMNGNIAHSTLGRTSDNTFLALGSVHVDSVDANVFKMVYFDRAGNILNEIEAGPGFNIAINDFVLAANDYLYLAITKGIAGSKSKASAAMFSPEGNMVWETELYNNKRFAAASLSVEKDDDGRVFVAGRVELTVEDGTLINSFLSCLEASTGNVLWKKYLESANAGVEIDFDTYSNVHMLNMNCFLINIIGLPDGSTESLFRPFEVCDSYDTDARAASMKINDDGDYLLAGSKSGKYYYALRKGTAGSETGTSE